MSLPWSRFKLYMEPAEDGQQAPASSAQSISAEALAPVGATSSDVYGETGWWQNVLDQAIGRDTPTSVVRHNPKSLDEIGQVTKEFM